MEQFYNAILTVKHGKSNTVYLVGQTTKPSNFVHNYVAKTAGQCSLERVGNTNYFEGKHYDGTTNIALSFNELRECVVFVPLAGDSAVYL